MIQELGFRKKQNKVKTFINLVNILFGDAPIQHKDV